MSTDRSTSLTASGLTVRYGQVLALDRIDLEVPTGATVAVLGPNGSGKSTLFHVALGLIEPAAGQIRLSSRRVAFVPQGLELEPTFPVTVNDVVKMGRWRDLGWRRRFRSDDYELVEKAMKTLAVSELADRRLGDLSSGQRQRVLLAQAVAENADILMLDEPLTGVDRPTRDALQTLIKSWRTEGRTVIVATHNLESAVSDFDFVLCLNRRLVKFGPARETCTEEVLQETFSGHLARVGGLLLDTEHRHPGAG